MIAQPNSLEPHSREQLPGSRRIYVAGRIHPDVRVPMREITLTPTKLLDGRIETNEPVRVYDCSGPWGDPEFQGDVEHGLPPLRRPWILARGDVAEYNGRPVQPIDDGFLSTEHRSLVQTRRQDETSFRLDASGLPQRRVLRAKPGKVVTQLACARAGVITPEMEFIALRENLQGAQAARLSADPARIGDLSRDNARNDLMKQHAGSSPISNLKSHIMRLRFSAVSRSASRGRSLLNSSVPKSLPAAPSFPPTSTIPNSNR